MRTVDVKIDVLLGEGRDIEVRWYLSIVVKKHREKRVENKVIGHLDFLCCGGLVDGGLFTRLGFQTRPNIIAWVRCCMARFYFNRRIPVIDRPFAVNKRDKTTKMMATTSHKQLGRPQPVAAESHVVESQCETVYDDEDDDELTDEEDEDDEDDEDEDDEDEEGEDSEETLTDASSSPKRTKDAASNARPASLSPDVQKLISQMPEVSQHFRIVSKIGEGISMGPLVLVVSPNLTGLGTFSSVYKAVDVNYHIYDNSWDANWVQIQKYDSPPIKKRKENEAKRPLKYVALKRIYVTSSPSRILNELHLLHHLKSCLR